MQFSLCSSRRFWYLCFGLSHLLLGCLKVLINFLNKATHRLTLTRWSYHWKRGLSTHACAQESQHAQLAFLSPDCWVQGLPNHAE